MPAPSHEPTALEHPLTIAEYARLGEPRSGHTELIEGSLLTSPGPTPKHSMALFKLGSQLEPQLPDGMAFVLDVDIGLGLSPPGGPGFSRRPDLIIVESAEVDRVEANGGILRASTVRVVVEIVSPNSRRTDKIHKRSEYEDAGIPWYWMIDLRRPVSLVACHRIEQHGYQDHQRVTGTFTTEEPFPVTLDLDRLG